MSCMSLSQLIDFSHRMNDVLAGLVNESHMQSAITAKVGKGEVLCSLIAS